MMGREAEDDASDTVASRAKAFPNSRVERPKKGGGDAGHDTRAKSNLGYRAFFFLVKPSSYSRTTYTDGRGDDGENTKAEARD